MPRIRLRQTEKKKKACEWVFVPEAGWCSVCYANLTFRSLKQHYSGWEMKRSEVFVREAKWNLRFESYIVLSSQKAEKGRVYTSTYMFRALLRRVLTLGIMKHCLVSVMSVYDAVTTFEVMYLDIVQRLETGSVWRRCEGFLLWRMLSFGCDAA